MKRSILGTVKGAIACDAFWSVEDGRGHTVILTENGTLTGIAYREGGDAETYPIATVPGARDVTAFWSEIDDLQNVIAVTASGQVSHFSRKATAAWSRAERREVPGARRVAAYDNHHHGIVLTEGGEVTDQPFHLLSPAVKKAFTTDRAAALQKVGKSPAPVDTTAQASDEEPAILVANSPAAIDVAALWAHGDNRFVVLGESSGAVTEFGYGLQQPESRRELARVEGLRGLSASFLGDPASGRRVLVLTERGEVHELAYGDGLPKRGAPLATGVETDIACFTTPQGDLRVVTLSGDQVAELRA